MIRINELDGHYHDIRVVKNLPTPTGNYKSLYTILDQDCMQVFYRMNLEGTYDTLGTPVALQSGVTFTTHIVRGNEIQEVPPTSIEAEDPSEDDTAIIKLDNGIIEFWTYKNGSWIRDFFGNAPKEDVVTKITTHVVREDDVEEVPPTNNEISDPIEGDTAIVKLSDGSVEFWTYFNSAWGRDFIVDNSQSSLFPTQEVTCVFSNGKSLGKYVNGDTIPVYNNPTEMVLDLAVERIAPTIISNRSVTLTLNTSTVEVGTELSFTLSSSFNRGLIDNKDRVDNTFLVGAGGTPLYSGLGLDPNNELTNVIETTDNEVSLDAIEGNMTWTVKQPYSAGTDPYYDSAGNPANDLDASRVAGSVSNSKTKVGRYNIFAGATNSIPNTNSELRNFDKGFDNVNTTEFRSGTNNLVFFVSKKQEVGSPATISGNNIDGLGAPVTLENKTTASCTLPNGSTVVYDVWSTTINNPYSSNDLLRFNI